MIEPIVIVVMGVVIGSIVIAMFLPMFEMGGMVSE
jgi:type II secretory pathway component PulF